MFGITKTPLDIMAIGASAPVEEEEMPIGSVIAHAGALPANWLDADGSTGLDSVVANPEYAALFAVIGTTFGGTGAADFDLPDLRGRVVLGINTGVIADSGAGDHVPDGRAARTIGDSGGWESPILPYKNAAADAQDPSLGPIGNGVREWTFRNGEQADSQLGGNMPPFLALRPIIRYA